MLKVKFVIDYAKFLELLSLGVVNAFWEELLVFVKAQTINVIRPWLLSFEKFTGI